MWPNIGHTGGPRSRREGGVAKKHSFPMGGEGVRRPGLRWAGGEEEDHSPEEGWVSPPVDRLGLSGNFYFFTVIRTDFVIFYPTLKRAGYSS